MRRTEEGFLVGNGADVSWPQDVGDGGTTVIGDGGSKT